jgi:aconitate hydratase
MTQEPLGIDAAGHPVFLREIWPSSQEIQDTVAAGIEPKMFKTRYSHIHEDNPVWDRIQVRGGAQYAWKETSTYIRTPPYFAEFSLNLPKRKEFSQLRPLALLGDSVTTDHISPAGAFKAQSPAGQYLLSCGVTEHDFNSYGSRRGNHEVMMRGTFANVRIVNKMAGGKEGGYTRLMPEEALMPIFDACQQYRERNIPLIIFAGKDYGMGSSRDWAAKGTALLGVRAVVAESFERIHRSNLIGMGVIPLKFQEGESWESLGITGTETFSLRGMEKKAVPQQEVILEIHRGSAHTQTQLHSCIDTPMEAEYYEHGGILDFVLRQLLSKE